MAAYEGWKNIVSRFYFDSRLHIPHRDAWSQNQLKKYLKYIHVKDAAVSLEEVPKRIWILWLQDIDHAPEIVKCCYESVRKYCPDYQITMLDESKVEQYVTLPDIIRRKWSRKQISPAHYSDMIRLSVLLKYGGIWMDATCLLTDRLPSYVERSKFFMFKADRLASFRSTDCSNWFIKSPRNNPLLIHLNQLLVRYHEKNKAVKDYFVFHQFLTLLVLVYPAYRKLWSEVPYITHMIPHFLWFEVGEPYDEVRYEEICRLSSIHKLTYKVSDQIKADRTNFYNFILHAQ